MAACDSNCRFMFVQAGWPGSVHDGRAFKSTALDGGDLVPLPYHLVADSAFKLRSWMMKPYPHSKEQTMETKFNNKLAVARVTIEMTFGQLKNRWRRLQDLDVDIKMAPKYILACCLLHNIGKERGDEWRCEEGAPNVFVPPDSLESDDEDDESMPLEAKLKRNEIAIMYR
jgi:hypothetical protein